MIAILNTVLKCCLITLLGLTLVSCVSRVNQDNFEKIQSGMTMQQVVTILGEPTTSDAVNIAGLSGTMATWKSNNAVITVQFLNNAVVIKAFSKQPNSSPLQNNVNKNEN